MQRLDQINAFKPANLFDFKSLALKIRKKQIGRFKTVIRQGQWLRGPHEAGGIAPAVLLSIGRSRVRVDVNVVARRVAGPTSAC